MHSWLPDAHSQAPAPVSGLMSGVLLSVAFYAILRVQAVVDPVLGTGLMRGLLVAAGLLSLAVAAALIMRQRDLKRMLAYSSIEHMGLLALAAAIGGTLALSRGPVARARPRPGQVQHCSSSPVESCTVEGTTRIGGHPRPARPPARPWPSRTWPAWSALLGLPPFSLFFSEVAIVVAGFQRRPRLGHDAGRGAAAGPVRGPRPALGSHDCSVRASEATPPEPRPARAAGSRSCSRWASRRSSASPPGHFATLLTQAACRPGGCPMTRRPNTDVLDVTERRRCAAEVARPALPTGSASALVARRRGRRLLPRRLRARPASRRPPRRAGPPDPAGRNPAIPSLAALDYPAGRFEREIRDLYGITPRRPPAALSAGPARPLAAGLVPDAARRRPHPPLRARRRAPSRSSRSRATASTRSRSDPSTPA